MKPFSPSRPVILLLLSLIFLASFFARATHPVSRPDQWLARSDVFNAAIEHADWAATFTIHHPGYTVMAIGGVSLRAFDGALGTPSEALFAWAVPEFTTLFGRRMAAGVLGLAIVISTLIVLIVLALKRLANWEAALAAGGLLALSPFFLGEGRVFHVDALVSSLMLLSALLILIYLDKRQWLFLILSGMVAGFALLTKAPSLFLLPFTGLALLVATLETVHNASGDHSIDQAGWLVRLGLRDIGLPLLLWMVCAVLPFVLWPAMWLDPLGVISGMINGTADMVENTHPVPRFYAGGVYFEERMPISFYPVMLLYQASFVTLGLLIIGLGLYLAQLARPRAQDWRSRLPVKPQVFWLLAAFVLFFTIQMTIGAKYDKRYILPAQAMLEPLAAIGLAGLIGLLGAALANHHERLLRSIPALLLTLALGMQALAVLPYFPDFGSHRNHLLGGNQGAVGVVPLMGQNEGVIDVARYLHQHQRIDFVGVSYPFHFSLPQYYAGQVERAYPEQADLHLASRIVRERFMDSEQWIPVLVPFERGETAPRLIVSYDGVDYLWLFGNPADPASADPLRINRGGAGLTVLAWLWWVLTLGLTLWAISRQMDERIDIHR
ncbi:MAG: hypothetical protein GYB68_00020 [Chloroflexi bacterium]|nr:hypothetical protein [Chloroflexota bacterium]